MSKVTFFDLASVFNTPETKHNKECVSVNKSILTLSRCFKSLVQKSSSSESNRSILNKGRFNQPRRSGGGSGQ